MQNRNKLRFKGFTHGSLIKNLPADAGDVGLILGQEDPPEEEMATHSSILAWRIPWTGEPWQATVHGVAKSQTRLGNYIGQMIFRLGNHRNLHKIFPV